PPQGLRGDGAGGRGARGRARRDLPEPGRVQAGGRRLREPHGGSRGSPGGPDPSAAGDPPAGRGGELEQGHRGAARPQLPDGGGASRPTHGAHRRPRPGRSGALRGPGRPGPARVGEGPMTERRGPGERNIEAMRGQGPGGFAPPIAQLLGMRAVAFEEGGAVLELDAEGRHANPMGTLHGGVLCDLADLAMGVACSSTLERGESFTTLELKINFLKPVWTGRLTARAQVKKGGRTTMLLECAITDEG